MGGRAVFQHDNEPQTHLQDDHCLAKEAECKGDETLLSILKRKVEERKVSNILPHERIPVASCEALVNSMPNRVKENNGGHTKY